MKKQIVIFSMLIFAFAGTLAAHTAMPDTLLFVFKLHGQTRKYDMSFRQQQDTLYLNWGIERYLKWQSGSYAMSPESVEKAVRLSFLQPDNGKHVHLCPEETAFVLSRTAYRQLKQQNSFVYNQTTYAVLDSSEQALGHPLIHVKDEAEGAEVWILDNPELPLVWRMKNNPLGVNWEAERKQD